MPLPWHQAPEADRRALESLDPCAPIRNKLRQVADEKGEWAGFPLPFGSDNRLIIHPKYPWRDAFVDREPPAPVEDTGLRIRSQFWSTHRSSMILIIEEDGKRITWGVKHGLHHFDTDFQTMACADAWGIEQESAALHLLATLLPHHAFKRYLLTGMFLEISKRSGVCYMFRRLKPTVAFRDQVILCALCLHPIAYYEGSWAGAMCPTDDVIAHLMLMRGDEAMFWRRANQHHAIYPEAGL